MNWMNILMIWHGASEKSMHRFPIWFTRDWVVIDRESIRIHSFAVARNVFAVVCQECLDWLVMVQVRKTHFRRNTSEDLRHLLRILLNMCSIGLEPFTETPCVFIYINECVIICSSYEFEFFALKKYSRKMRVEKPLYTNTIFEKSTVASTNLHQYR